MMLRSRAIIQVLTLVVCGAAAAADDEIKLGPITGYRSEAEAKASCKDDAVVWADRKTGFLYPPFLEQYGRTATGTFTCYKEAKKADYWGFGTVDTLGLKGKSFPIVTCPLCF